MDCGDSAMRLLSNRIDFEAFEDYDRLLTLHFRSSEGTVAAVPMPEPVFECGLFMVVYGDGLLINSEWSDADGCPLGYLRFGEIFAVVELSPRYDGHYVAPHYEAGRVRARVERWDGVSGYISLYNTRCMQHFAVSMDGEPPWFRPGDLLRRLIDGLQRPRLPLAAPPMAFENQEEEWVEPDAWRYLEDPMVVAREDGPKDCRVVPAWDRQVRNENLSNFGPEVKIEEASETTFNTKQEVDNFTLRPGAVAALLKAGRDVYALNKMPDGAEIGKGKPVAATIDSDQMHGNIEKLLHRKVAPECVEPDAWKYRKVATREDHVVTPIDSDDDSWGPWGGKDLSELKIKQDQARAQEHNPWQQV
jgi:hypothetical protein